MYVLHVVSGLFVGGGQVGVTGLVEKLRGYESMNARICTLGEPDLFFSKMQPISVSEYDGRYNNLRVVWRSARALRRVIKTEKPDIVHSHGWDADFISAVSVLGLSVRHVSHIRSMQRWAEVDRASKRLRRCLTRLLLRSSGARFIAVSKAVKDHACSHLGWDPEKVRVVPNDADIDRYGQSRTTENGRVETRRIIGSAGRLTEEKGFDVLLEAVAGVKARHARIALRIAGTGPLLEWCESRAAELGLGETVEFLGMVEDMPLFYRDLDIFVLASRTEGMPRAVAEAMAAGVPVVATEVGGTAELLRHGREGFLVEPNNAQTLADAIYALLTEDDTRSTMSLNCRRRIEEGFTSGHTAAAVLDVYKTLLAYPGGVKSNHGTAC